MGATTDSEVGRDARRRRQLEAAAAAARLGLWEYCRRDSCFRWSEAVYEIFGLQSTDDLGLETVSRLYAGGAAGQLVRAIQLALEEGKPFSLVSEIETPAGQRKWIRTQGQPGDDGDEGSAHVFGTVQDISEMRLLDRVTQESEMTLNQVEQITRIGHWSVSLADGSFYHSDEVKRIFGYEPSEYALSVEEAINAYHPDDRDEVIRLFNRAIETGENYEFDLRIVQPSGETRYVHSKGYTEKGEGGDVVRVYGVFQDITDHVRTEMALRESEASMKALVDSVRTAIVVHGRDGEILLSNQMANKLLSPLATEVVGRNLGDPAWRFVFEDGRRVAVEEFPVSQIIRTGKPVENLVMGRPDGDRIAWLLVNGIPVLDKHGELSKIVISFVDLTAHKEMEEQLHQSEKMKAIGQLAGGVAHDFNNQLAVVLNFAALLEKHLDASSAEASYIDGILAAVSRASDLTKQLLAFARKGKYVVTGVDVNEVIAEVVSIARHSFDKKIRVTHQANASEAMILGDVSQLQNAFLNIALNARDAMPEGGELTFVTERVTLDEEWLRAASLELEPGENLRITVRDTGAGMDAETRKHMFEPFYTTKEQGKGTGMGMASVYGTVTNHHGAILVDSEPGHGTTVTMYFAPAAGEAQEEPDSTPRPAMSRGRLLLVDDEKAVAKSMSMMLDAEGYETITCTGGRDALREFRTSWKEIELVILDMIMPDMNGVETFAAMREIDPDAKVLLVSGYSFTDEAKRVIEEGAVGFLQKPVDIRELLQTISALLGGSD